MFDRLLEDRSCGYFFDIFLVDLKLKGKINRNYCEIYKSLRLIGTILFEFGIKFKDI